MQKNNKFIKALLLFWSCSFVIIIYFCSFFGIKSPQNWVEKKVLAEKLLLTDYCLSTESRHTRHFTMPDYFAPFQDFPAYHEHFPSSSFFPMIMHKKRK